MPLRLTIHNSLLLAFLLMSLMLLASITITWRAFEQVKDQQEVLIESQIPRMQALGDAVDDGLILLGLASTLSRDIDQEEYDRISSEANAMLVKMDADLVFFRENEQQFEVVGELIIDTQALLKEMQSLLQLRKAAIDNRSEFNLRQADLQRQIESANVVVRLIVAEIPDGDMSADSIDDLLFSVKRMEDIIRFLILIDSPTLLEQEKNQYRLLLNRLSFQMLAFAPEQRQGIVQALTPLQANLVEDNNLFEIVAKGLALEASLLTHQEAVAQLSIRLNEEYREISLASNVSVEQSAVGLLETILSSKYRLLVSSLFFLLFMLLLFYYFVRPKIIERLQKLNDSTRAIGAGDFKAAIDIDGNDEISEMAKSLAYFRDELIQKQSDQETLAAKEQSLSTLIKNVSEGLFTVDVAGNIQSFNPACEYIFDIDEKAVLGSSIYQFFPEQKTLFNEHQQGWVEENDQGYVLCERLKVAANNYSGANFTASLSVTLVRLREQLIYTCFVRDVTAEELSKKQLDQLVQELSESNVDLERFAYSCSHDLQEPIRMVVSFSELLKKHLDDKGEMDETSERYLDFISEGSVNAKQLVIDILGYSRLSQSSSKKEWFVVAGVFEQIQSMLHNFLEEKNGQFLIENGGIQILAVPAQFKQLLMNLMINGLKYNESEEPTVTVSLVDEDEHWLISVADNGIGIDPQYQDKIFNLFTRLVSRREYSGSGIGLSLCKKIVDKHKGTIAVTSKAGEGARFDVRLPKFNESDV